jgi:hypothetical protein
VEVGAALATIRAFLSRRLSFVAEGDQMGLEPIEPRLTARPGHTDGMRPVSRERGISVQSSRRKLRRCAHSPSSTARIKEKELTINYLAVPTNLKLS